jgi:hypothetical protein
VHPARPVHSCLSLALSCTHHGAPTSSAAASIPSPSARAVARPMASPPTTDHPLDTIRVCATTVGRCLPKHIACRTPRPTSTPICCGQAPVASIGAATHRSYLDGSSGVLPAVKRSGGMDGEYPQCACRHMPPPPSAARRVGLSQLNRRARWAVGREGGAGRVAAGIRSTSDRKPKPAATAHVAHAAPRRLPIAPIGRAAAWCEGVVRRTGERCGCVPTCRTDLTRRSQGSRTVRGGVVGDRLLPNDGRASAVGHGGGGGGAGAGTMGARVVRRRVAVCRRPAGRLEAGCRADGERGGESPPAPPVDRYVHVIPSHYSPSHASARCLRAHARLCPTRHQLLSRSRYPPAACCPAPCH